MTTAITEQANREIARPLKVLVPLIKSDLEQGREASERAGLPYYRAAGEKMIEAKEQIAHGEFQNWIQRNFKISQKQASIWMNLARQNLPAGKFSSISEAYRATINPNYNKPSTVRPQAWHEPVKQIMGRVDIETLRDSELKRAEEREAERKLALQLIDIGYKTLATKLHPDRGGSRDAMARLNHVRDRLKQHA